MKAQSVPLVFFGAVIDLTEREMRVRSLTPGRDSREAVRVYLGDQEVVTIYGSAVIRSGGTVFVDETVASWLAGRLT